MRILMNTTFFKLVSRSVIFLAGLFQMQVSANYENCQNHLRSGNFLAGCECAVRTSKTNCGDAGTRVELITAFTARVEELNPNRAMNSGALRGALASDQQVQNLVRSAHACEQNFTQCHNLCSESERQLRLRLNPAPPDASLAARLNNELRTVQDLKKDQNEDGCYFSLKQTAVVIEAAQNASMTRDDFLAIHRATTGGGNNTDAGAGNGNLQRTAALPGRDSGNGNNRDGGGGSTMSSLMSYGAQAIAVGSIGYGVGCMLGEFGCKEKKKDDKKDDDEKGDGKDRVELPEGTAEEFKHCAEKDSFGKTSCARFFQANCTAKHTEKGCEEYNQFFCGFGAEKPAEAPGLDSGYCHRQLANRFCASGSLNHCVSCHFINDRSSPAPSDCAMNHNLCLPNLSIGEQRQFAQTCPQDPILLRAPVAVAKSYFAPAQLRTDPNSIYATSSLPAPPRGGQGMASGAMQGTGAAGAVQGVFGGSVSPRNSSSGGRLVSASVGGSVDLASTAPIGSSADRIATKHQELGVSGPGVDLFKHSSQVMTGHCESGELRCPF